MRNSIDSLAKLRGSADNCDNASPLKEGDTLKLTVNGDSLFLSNIEIFASVGKTTFASQHQQSSLYHNKAVAVDGDGGMVDNIAKYQAKMEKMAPKKEEVKDENPDVEDDEWD